ncbi:MAG: DHH family phosphoesterase, partial [Candidatus Limnocylindrales bacterium]
MTTPAPASVRAADVAAVPEAVLARLRTARRVLTVCHENPEADALGSALAHALIVEALGGLATPVCADPVPPMYGFLPGLDRFRQAPDPDLDYDLIVVGDCGDLARVGPLLDSQAELFGRVPILDIDHHRSNRGFGAINWIDPEAAATCEMTTLLALALDLPLDLVDGALAANLMAGLVIDTATFQHPNVTPRTLRVAAELVAAGAPLADTSRRLYRTKPDRQLRLFGLVLARLEARAAGRVAWSTLAESDLATSGATAADSEGLIDLLSQAEGAEVVILFKEAGRETRLSVRTRDGGVDAT